MKKNFYKFAFFFVALVLLYLGSSAIAQVPGKFSYQAVIRDADNHVVENSQVGIQVSIIQNEKDGQVVYVETHAPETNENGLVSIQIGTGEVESGEFEAVDWSEGPFYIQTEIDPDGGSSYSIEGVTEILSVPYAFHANTADDLSGEIITELQDQNQALAERVDILEAMLADHGYHKPIQDVDGNVYNVVEIGDQMWMAENLRTKSFADGTPISTPEDQDDWAGSSEPMMGVMNYEEVDGLDSEEEALKAYGAVYNGFAVTAEREICPPGYRVPTKEDYQELEDYISAHDAEEIGTQLKGCREPGSDQGGECDVDSEDHPNWMMGGGTDDWGFSGYGPSYMSSSGDYVHGNVTLMAYFWTKTVDEEDDANLYARQLGFHLDNFPEGTFEKNWGYSVRCIKDQTEE